MQKLNQTLNQKLTLSPQQIQFLGLLQIPIIDLEKRIESEIEDNPTLEEDEEETILDKYETNYSAKEQGRKTDFIVNNLTNNTDTLASFLHKQLIGNNLHDNQLTLVKYIIDSLDDNGFLRRDLESVISDFFISTEVEVSKEKMLEAIKTIQNLEPAGVGAKDLKECLLIQIKKKSPKNKSSIVTILETFYHEFTNKNFEKIIKELQITSNELGLVYKEVEKLNPIPGGSFSKNKDTIQYIVPDFKMTYKNGILDVTVNKSNTKRVTVNAFYNTLLSETKDSATKDFLTQKLDKARWFVDALNKRYETLELVMVAIKDIQQEYFVSGKESDLRPMKLADIAEKVHLDISTISRVTNSKYVETSFGTYLLKDFFSEAYRKDNGDIISTKEIKNKLSEIVRDEDKNSPYTDEWLCKLLGQEEYHIARRTVAKYREKLSIPIAKLRRKI
tara:strand:+ start:225 stop:1562 length:1338 start_codon:yes stop_codon:yes gene_type:complete